MRDTKRCKICGSDECVKKNDMCSNCSHELGRLKMATRGVIFNSIRYGVKSYIWKFLPYTVEELKEHLEKQFEPWMTWDNWGSYDSKTWDENDSTTWKWNIDHIVPQSNFLFLSVRDSEFVKCWSLNNLRPLSAKQNLFESNRATS